MAAWRASGLSAREFCRELEYTSKDLTWWASRLRRSGALFVFYGKRKSALKVLFYDGTGLCLFYKRLDRGTFRVPSATHADATSVVLSESELDDLLDGIDVEVARKLERKPRTRMH